MRVSPSILAALIAALLAGNPSAIRAAEQSNATQAEKSDVHTAPSHDAEATHDTHDGEGGGLLALLPQPVKTSHSIAANGRTLSYSATAGTLGLIGGDGDTIARMFYVAYDLDQAEEGSGARPITFVFNGGPGAASAYLQLGALGPRILRTGEDGEFLPPPQRLQDNPDTWLPMTDLVFVDPVGTGYSRAAPGHKPEQFWGVDQDAAAMGAFIRRYLDEAGRRDSPVYLVGESYGGFRAALLADKLQEDDGIAPSGIVLISPALDFSFIYGESPLQWALSLPSMAAANFERQGLRGEKLRAGLAKVEHYALTDYLVALASGLKEGGATASETVAGLTGLPLDLVERHFARIPVQLFAREFDRVSGRVASPYDTAISAPDIAPESARLVTPDPVLDRSIPAVTSAFVHYVREELNYRTPISYKLLNEDVTKDWDYGTSASRQGYADAVDDLQKARALDPSMRILIANGLTDLVTPYSVSRYIVQHLPPLAGAEPIETGTYEGGHMMYLRPGSRHELKDDATRIYNPGH